MPSSAERGRTEMGCCDASVGVRLLLLLLEVLCDMLCDVR